MSLGEIERGEVIPLSDLSRDLEARPGFIEATREALAQVARGETVAASELLRE